MVALKSIERRSAILLFIYGFGNAAAYVVARTVADSQFLSRIGPDQLPKVYLAAAGLVALVSAIYGRCVRRASVRRSVIFTLVTLASVTALLPEFVHHFPQSPIALASVYLIVQVRGSLGTIQFTMLLNEQFAHRSPERVVGFVGIGSTLAGFSVGLTLGQFADLSDLATLMYFVAGIDVLTTIPVRMLPPGGSLGRPSVPKDFFWRNPEDGDENQLKAERSMARYVIRVAGMVAVGVLAATFVEYQWKVAVAEEFQRDEQDLARYFGTFYGCIYLITGMFQLFVTALVLKHKGLLVGLLVFPVSLFLTSGAVLFASAGRILLWAVTVAKGCDILKRSMNEPSIHLLYSPLERRYRHQVITFVAGIVKPLTEAAAGLCLVLLAPVISLQSLSMAVIVLVIMWLILDVLVWRAFAEMKRGIIEKAGDKSPGDVS